MWPSRPPTPYHPRDHDPPPPIHLPMAGGRPQPAMAMFQPASPPWAQGIPPPASPGSSHFATTGLSPVPMAKNHNHFSPQPPFNNPTTSGLTTPVTFHGTLLLTEAAPISSPLWWSPRHSSAPVPVSRTKQTALLPSPLPWSLPDSKGPLYGKYVFEGGGLGFEPTERFDEWLDNVQTLTLKRQNRNDLSDFPYRGSRSDSHVGTDRSDVARVGDKRRSGKDNDHEERPTKRSRVGAAFQRTVSRLSQRRPSIVSSAVISTTAASTRGGANTARIFTPFSIFSRPPTAAGTVAATSMSMGPSPSTVARTIKICLVGDSGSGKTSLINRLVHDYFKPELPSTKAPYSKTAPFRADDGSLVNVELWDIPGSLANKDGAGPLGSTFFHAAVICVGLEKKSNVKNVAAVWRPKINISLHDQPVYLLGLKADMRPEHPVLPLSFLPSSEPVSSQLGEHLALVVAADHYAECSARTGDNVDEAFGEIVNQVLERVVEHEHAMKSQRKREWCSKAVAGMLSKVRPGKDKEGRHAIVTMNSASRAGAAGHGGPSSASSSSSSPSLHPPQARDVRPPLPRSPSSTFLFPPAPPPLHITIRFSTALPDLHLDIPSPHQTTVVALKHLIRDRLAADAETEVEADLASGKRPYDGRRIPAAQAATARLRFIQNGRILPDPAVLSAVLRAPPPPPPSQHPDPKGKSPVGVPPRAQQRVFINCSIGDTLSLEELYAEAAAATAPVPPPPTPPAPGGTQQSINTHLSPPGTQSSTSTRRTPVPNLAINTNLPPSSTSPNHIPGPDGQSRPAPRPQGFDRLTQAGLTPSEIATLRAHFRAIHTARFAPDSMPSPDTLRAMEDAWLDGDSSWAGSSQPSRSYAAYPYSGGWAGGGGGGMDEDAQAAAAAAAASDDAFGLSAVAGPLIKGMLIGFVFPLGVIGWLGKEDGVWSRRMQVFVNQGRKKKKWAMARFSSGRFNSDSPLFALDHSSKDCSGPGYFDVRKTGAGQCHYTVPPITQARPRGGGDSALAVGP
ncbi:hypothetical protein VTJ49DRAFT_5284 [Mycothermus thermophilus]|uniref:Uncharacterized protein n=1 Tax=Humicola insolens TaxID=85995 RepID=A0ABR3VL04_HUMIN